MEILDGEIAHKKRQEEKGKQGEEKEMKRQSENENSDKGIRP